MMRTASACALMILVSLPGRAADRQLTISDPEYMMWSNVGPVMDRCIGAMVLRRDAAACADVSAFIAEFAAKVGKAAPVAAAPQSTAPAAPSAPAVTPSGQ